MIVTVTLNPSLDRTLRVPELVVGEVLRVAETRTDPGGKGVNVSRALEAHGTATRAVLPVGGAVGTALTALLAKAGVDAVAVPVAGASRSNVTVVEPDGTTTKLNEPGPELSALEIDAVVAAATRDLGAGDWVVAAGSITPGAPDDVYARLADAAHARGARIALDSSGEAFKAGLAASPDLVKPNNLELGELLGRTLGSLGEVREGCEQLVADGVGTVLCSLGADGALLVRADGAWYGRGPKVAVRNTVGAGDSLLAGYLHALVGGASAPDALREGLAWAAAAVSTLGTGVPPTELIRPEEVVISTTFDSAQRLEDAA